MVFGSKKLLGIFAPSSASEQRRQQSTATANRTNVNSAIDHQLRQSIESAERCKRMLADAEDAGLKTIRNLDHQRGQLNTSEAHLNDATSCVARGDRHLTRCVYGPAGSVLRVPRFVSSKLAAATSRDKQADGAEVEVQEQVAYKSHVGQTLSDDVNVAIAANQFGALNRQVEMHLDDIDHQICTLRDMAVEINGELGAHKQKIDRLERKTVKTDADLQRHNNRVAKLVAA